MTAARAWLDARSPRERRLLAVAAAAAATVLAGAAALAIRDHLGALEARVAGRERQLADVRRMADILRRAPAPPGGTAPGTLVGRLEAAAVGVVGRDRIAGLTPGGASPGDGGPLERATLRVAGASLAEAVHLLHALEAGGTRVAAFRLEKHPDDPTRFEATLEAVAGGERP